MMLSHVCLSVCLRSDAYIGPKSRTERPRKTKIGTEVAHVTGDWLAHHFQRQKVKGQGHQAALLTEALTHQAAAAVSVGTYWPWEPTATLRSALFRRGGLCGATRPHRKERGGGILWRPSAYCLFLSNDIHKTSVLNRLKISVVNKFNNYTYNSLTRRSF